MTQEYKIAVIGIGGVGGYVGAKLAAHYHGTDNVKIIFFARGENEAAIKNNGLKLITGNEEIICQPSVVTSVVEEIGQADLIICCVKNYNLDESIRLLKPAVKQSTIFLPLLNGLDAPQKIKKIYPYATVADGCIYLVARLIAPGIVQQFGNTNQLWFGMSGKRNADFEMIESVISAAGINVAYTQEIEQVCWEKYFLISTIATLTSYLDASIGDVLNNGNYKEMLLGLMGELLQTAIANGVTLPVDIVEKTISKLSAMPYASITSMHADFKKGNFTELSSLTGYVVSLARQYHISAPYYTKMFATLSQKN